VEERESELTSRVELDQSADLDEYFQQSMVAFVGDSSRTSKSNPRVTEPEVPVLDDGAKTKRSLSKRYISKREAKADNQVNVEVF